MDLAVHKIVAFCSSGILFQTLAITFEANLDSQERVDQLEDAALVVLMYVDPFT